MEGIKKVVWECESNKVPDPNGFFLIFEEIIN